MNEIELRRSTVSDVASKQRLVDLIAVPWEQETEVGWRGDVWREVFLRGAFDGIEERAGRVRVNREHIKGDTVGKVVEFDPSNPDGLFTRVKIANTQRGDDTLALAEEDMLSASVGFVVKRARDMHVNTRDKIRIVKRAFLDHLAMVESPAYDNAKVLAVREDPTELVEPAYEATPVLDRVRSDDLLLWASSRVGHRQGGVASNQEETNEGEPK